MTPVTSTYEIVEAVNGGEVTHEPFLRQSDINGGCGLPGCSCSPGHWLSLSDGLHVFVVHFQSREDLKTAIEVT